MIAAFIIINLKTNLREYCFRVQYFIEYRTLHCQDKHQMYNFNVGDNIIRVN